MSIPQVLEEINQGLGLRVADAAHRWGKNPATAHRWALTGVLLPDGRRLKLEAVQLGSTWHTSEPALARFAAARTSARPGGDGAAESLRSPSARQRASEAAERQLAQAGI